LTLAGCKATKVAMAGSSEAKALDRTALPDRRLQLRDGSAAEVVDDALELRSPDGRLLLRYRDGSAELIAPDGDLVLAAPAGKIVLESATDVELRAARDIRQVPGRRATIEAADATLEVSPTGIRSKAPRFDVTAQRSRVAVGEASFLAGHVATSAEHIVTEVQRYELTAERLVERSRDTFREVTGLLQEKAGRIRTFVKGVRALYTNRTVMVSKKDTSIDGEKVLLG
jgi:hypothetical protein